MKAWKHRTGIAAAALIALGIGAGKTDAAGFVTTSLLLPLSGVIQPGDPCAPTDTVALSGYVHAVTAVVPPDPIQPQGAFKVFLNMADVTGTGTPSGNLYIGTGAFHQANNVLVPPSPILPIFQLQGTVGCMSTPLPVTVRLMFDSAGNLLADGSSATLGQCLGDSC